jgi:hypothetical protein
LTVASSSLIGLMCGLSWNQVPEVFKSTDHHRVDKNCVLLLNYCLSRSNDGVGYGHLVIGTATDDRQIHANLGLPVYTLRTSEMDTSIYRGYFLVGRPQCWEFQNHRRTYVWGAARRRGLVPFIDPRRFWILIEPIGNAVTFQKKKGKKNLQEFNQFTLTNTCTVMNTLIVLFGFFVFYPLNFRRWSDHPE